jgi:hypothetical protein
MLATDYTDYYLDSMEKRKNYKEIRKICGFLKS